MLVRGAAQRQTAFGPWFGAKMEVANDVALEANFEGKRSEEDCYGGVGSRWGLVAGRRRVRFK